jgi:hypothetical protein
VGKTRRPAPPSVVATVRYCRHRCPACIVRPDPPLGSNLQPFSGAPPASQRLSPLGPASRITVSVMYAHVRGSDGGIPSLFDKHHALLTTCERAIAPGGCVLVFYTHHRPHLAQRDMAFFDMARDGGWECEKVLTKRFPVRFSAVSEVSLFVSLNIFGHLSRSAHVSGGPGRRRGALDRARVETHASVTSRNVN